MLLVTALEAQVPLPCYWLHLDSSKTVLAYHACCQLPLSDAATHYPINRNAARRLLRHARALARVLLPEPL
jgi:hypothetical protein